MSEAEDLVVDLRGRQINTLSDFWDAIAGPCGLPSWFGRNIDAWSDTIHAKRSGPAASSEAAGRGRDPTFKNSAARPGLAAAEADRDRPAGGRIVGGPEGRSGLVRVCSAGVRPGRSLATARARRARRPA